MRFVHLHGGPAPVRRFLPEHMELIRQAPVACSMAGGEHAEEADGAVTDDDDDDDLAQGPPRAWR